jgi:hypothetical protein
VAGGKAGPLWHRRPAAPARCPAAYAPVRKRTPRRRAKDPGEGRRREAPLAARPIPAPRGPPPAPRGSSLRGWHTSCSLPAKTNRLASPGGADKTRQACEQVYCISKTVMRLRPDDRA